MQVRESTIKVCKNYCHYYKPAKDEKLACKGLLVIERIIENGGEIPLDMLDLSAKSDRIINHNTKEILFKNICISCPFYESDCDFAEQKEDSKPCGGFIFLGLLLEEDIISVDDIV